MSVSTLPVLTHPQFPQVLTRALNQEVTRVTSHPALSLCCHETVVEDGGTGEFNQAFPCVQPATIHDLATEQDYCFEHFRAVRRG
jgi:hypothetical protein